MSTTFSLGKPIANKFSRYRPKKGVSIGTLFGVISIVLYISYNAGFAAGKKQKNELPVQTTQTKLEQLQNENNTIKQQLMIATSNYQIQVEAQKNLTQHFKTLQESNTELSRDLALYQTIKGTPPQSGLQVKGFNIFSTPDKNTFRYLLVLTKQTSPSQYVDGAVSMTIKGKISGQSISLPVKYVDSSRSDGLAFKFRHFQELSGELSFPAQFIPQSVLFEVNPDKEWPKFTEEFPWDPNSINPDESA